jgi:leucyl/phenylalanyl-tRNA--protein transferase
MFPDNMGIVYLNKGDPFPDPNRVEESGLLAIGGELNVKTLLSAYSLGIFPWYSKGEPLMWWSPDPRMVLFPEEIHISGTMRKLLKKNIFNVTCNKNFESVIEKCRSTGSRANGTWITDEMVCAYTDFHRAGYAHSIEVWEGDELVGGFYGVSIGKIFFGESMFHLKKNASKYGFIKFVEYLKDREFILIDCQVYTKHMASLGACEITGEEFKRILKKGISTALNEKVGFDCDI